MPADNLSVTLYDWLSTPQGTEALHAVILLAVAAAGYLNWLSHRAAASARDAIEQHVKEHQVDDPEKH